MSTTSTRVRYGSHPRQFGELTVPGCDECPSAVVVLIHGGFWKAAYGLDLMRPVASDLAARGLAVWNLEYRSVGDDGGGYPGTLADIATGIDRLVDDDDGRLDLRRLVVVGHSAGGHLALWAGGRSDLVDGDVGSRPRLCPRSVIGLAAVTDVFRAAADGLGANATQSFLGGEPSVVPDAYRVAQPSVGAVPTVLVTGDVDDDVPPDYSRAVANRTGVDVVVVDGDDHFDVIDPASRSWRAVLAAIDTAVSDGQHGDRHLESSNDG